MMNLLILFPAERPDYSARSLILSRSNDGLSSTIYFEDFARANGLDALYTHIRSKVHEERISTILFEPRAIISPYLLLDLRDQYQLSLVSVCFDDEYLFELVGSVYARICDLVLTHDAVAAQRYRMAGVNAEWVMLRGQEPAHDRGVGNFWKRKISFVGTVSSSKPDRYRFINYLSKHNLEVEVRGDASPTSGSHMGADEMQKFFRTSQINLNFSGISLSKSRFSHALSDRIRGSKSRPFEIALAGGFCLSEHSLTLAAVFRDGIEIAYFYSVEDLVEKAKFYIANPEWCKSIAEAGHKRALEATNPVNVIGQLQALSSSRAHRRGENLYGEKISVEIPRYFRAMLIGHVFMFILKRIIKTGRLIEIYATWRLLKNFLIRTGSRFPTSVMLVDLCTYCFERLVLRETK